MPSIAGDSQDVETPLSRFLEDRSARTAQAYAADLHVFADFTGHHLPQARAALILDSGSGSGQWGFDTCDDFPEARVVGVDLVPSKPGRPARYRFVKGNLLGGLPFADDQFDFVHQRLLVAGIPLTAWPAVVSELARVTRPGGWVELVEGPWEFEGAGPATRRVFGLVGEMLAARGLGTTRVGFD